MREYLLPIALGLMLAGSGCATGGGDGARTTVYRLEAAPAAQQARYTPVAETLLIELPAADPGFDGRGIAYQEVEHELRYYTRSRWADAPARMIETALVNALESSGLFKAVLRGAGAAGADYRLRSELLRLEQIFPAGQPSHVELALRVQLIGGQPRQVLATRVIRARAPAGSEDAAGAVRGAHAALAQALGELVEFSAQTLGAQPAGHDSRNQRSEQGGDAWRGDARPKP